MAHLLIGGSTLLNSTLLVAPEGPDYDDPDLDFEDLENLDLEPYLPEKMDPELARDSEKLYLLVTPDSDFGPDGNAHSIFFDLYGVEVVSWHKDLWFFQVRNVKKCTRDLTFNSNRESGHVYYLDFVRNRQCRR